MSETDFEKCTTYRRAGNSCTISCNLGLWEVSGPYGLNLIDEAMHYFKKYKNDGEYSEMIGGPSSVEVLMKLGETKGDE